MIVERLSGSRVHSIGSLKNVVGRIAANRAPLWNELAKDTVMSFVLRTLPGRIGMSKVNFRSPLLQLGEVSEFCSVIDCNGLENFRETLSVEILERSESVSSFV